MFHCSCRGASSRVSSMSTCGDASKSAPDRSFGDVHLPIPKEKWDNGAIDGYTMLYLLNWDLTGLQSCNEAIHNWLPVTPVMRLGWPRLESKSRTEFELRRGTWATVGSWWFDIPIGGHQMPLKMGNRWASMKSIWVSHVTLRYIEWSL